MGKGRRVNVRHHRAQGSVRGSVRISASRAAKIILRSPSRANSSIEMYSSERDVISDSVVIGGVSSPVGAGVFVVLHEAQYAAFFMSVELDSLGATNHSKAERLYASTRSFAIKAAPPRK